MSAQRAIERVETTKIIAILRGDFRGCEITLAEPLVKAGISALEVSAVSPHFDRLVRNLHAFFGERASIGAGTVLTLEELHLATSAGAEFVVSPNTDPSIIAETKRLGLTSFPGAYTPSEIVLATRAGADAVKVFPAASLGVAYIKALAGPLPRTRLIPTGGITLQNIRDYLDAGAFAVGIGSELVGKDEIERPNGQDLLAKARAFAQVAQRNTHA